jgi:hypothetical protein
MHDVAYDELRYPNGVVGHDHVGWLESAKVRRFTVAGEEKRIVYTMWLRRENRESMTRE